MRLQLRCLYRKVIGSHKNWFPVYTGEKKRAAIAAMHCPHGLVQCRMFLQGVLNSLLQASKKFPSIQNFKDIMT